MTVNIGIRREDKNKWERRAPLTPEDIAALRAQHDLHFLVQPSPIRVFDDDAYRAAGAEVNEDISSATLVVAIKEIPAQLLKPNTTYIFFPHVIKGQPYNMGMLKRLMSLGCSLIDYERIVDAQNRRLIFFGEQAGQAGMLETLRGLGQRLKQLGQHTPLAQIRQAYDYKNLNQAKQHLQQIGAEIASNGLGMSPPLVVGIAGYGNVSRGAQQVLDWLPVTEITPAQLAQIPKSKTDIYKTVFREEHLARPRQPGAAFQLQEYYEHPERYQGCFEQYAPHLDVLVNTIYWEYRYPRLITKAWAKAAFASGQPPKLKIIGDISCDINGSIEFTAAVTQPDDPCFVYHPKTDSISYGFGGEGIVVMAVDNLPCELPSEASEQFSTVLGPMVADLAAADWSVPLEQLKLPPHLWQAVIVHRGELTEDYRYLEEHLKNAADD